MSFLDEPRDARDEDVPEPGTDPAPDRADGDGTDDDGDGLANPGVPTDPRNPTG